jgi:4-amino-4-deoxy-L-arabinose transferase
MTLPYDSASLIVATVAAALLLAGWRTWAAAGAGESRRAALVPLLFVVVAGGVLRTDSAAQRALHKWDERFHAVVAKNLMADPFTPTLYRDPAVEYDLRDWTSNHVWLHKPPLALWMMAGSMAVFGVDELAMRLPSMLLSTAAIVLTFLIGRRLFDDRTALLAASFHAVNAFLISLASGRRVADHVDTALLLFFELAVWLGLHASRSWAAVVVCGAAVGLGLLAKSVPALLALPVIFAAMTLTISWRAAAVRTTAAAGVAVCVAAPWTIYTWGRFPAEAAWEARYTLMHITQTLEGMAGGPLSYLRDFPRFFGELTILSIGFAAWHALWHRKATPPLTVAGVWILVPYLLFSIAATRLPAFVMVSAPAIFIVHGWVWWTLRDRMHERGGAARKALLVLLIVMAAAPARHLFEPTSVLERRDRDPAAYRELRQLTERIGPGDAVIFNLPFDIEAMFYTPYTAYSRLPTEEQVRRLAAAGRRVVIYQPGGDATVLPADWPVTYLRGSIRTRDAP